MLDVARLAAARRSVGSGWGTINPRRWEALTAPVDERETFLDVGCATGKYVERLRSDGYVAFGLDALPAKEWPAGFFLRADALHLPIRDDAVDTAFAFEVMEHVAASKGLLHEMARVARERIVISVPNCEVPIPLRRAGVTFHHWVDPSHVNFFTTESLADHVAGAGLRLETLETFNSIRPEYLAMTAMRIPLRLADRLARALEYVPWRQEYHMGLLATIRV